MPQQSDRMPVERLVVTWTGSTVDFDFAADKTVVAIKPETVQPGEDPVRALDEQVIALLDALTRRVLAERANALRQVNALEQLQREIIASDPLKTEGYARRCVFCGAYARIADVPGVLHKDSCLYQRCVHATGKRTTARAIRKPGAGAQTR